MNAVIIGAGHAGLTAAYEFLTQGHGKRSPSAAKPCIEGWDVTVIEEANCFGGISRTVLNNGNRMDMGGHARRGLFLHSGEGAAFARDEPRKLLY